MLITRSAGDKPDWTASARSPSGPRLALAAVGDFSGQGAPEAATVDARGVLRLWSLAPDRIAPGPEALGYTLGDGEADLAGTVPAEGGTDLALPVAGMPVVAVVTARGSRPGDPARAPADHPAGPGRDRHRDPRRGGGPAPRRRARGRTRGGRGAGGRTALSEAEARTFPTRPFVGASIAVIRDERVLLAARANEPMRGVWTLPGGSWKPERLWPRLPCGN